mgnify:CR=1 FL=1
MFHFGNQLVAMLAPSSAKSRSRRPQEPHKSPSRRLKAPQERWPSPAPPAHAGAPRTLIEAAAMARPLIATDVPGCRSVVDHGVSGLLCEPRNAQSLADSIETMLGLSPAERTAMGHAGRAKMERAFGHDIVVEAYRSVISRISSGQKGNLLMKVVNQ